MAIRSANGLDSIPAGALRFLRHDDAVRNRREMWQFYAENNTLREDSTREIDEALVRVARRDLIGVADLSGMRKSLDNGVGTTEYGYDKIAPVGKATRSMSILDHGDRDLVTFSRTVIPVPVISSQFRMDARQLAAGRGMGQSVDLSNIEEHTRSVAESAEDTLFNGAPEIVLNGNALEGYTNFSCRTSITIGTAWDSLTAGSIAGAVTDVLNAWQALQDDGFTGPYILYVPSTWAAVLEEDYKAESERTLRERILAIQGITAIKVSGTLPADNAVLVQMTRSVVEYPLGQELTVVTWDEFGGLASNWIILTVGTFALKCANARAPLSQGVLPALTTAAGIAHLS
jgi:uncharacterized linocin/CFP29 family protein